MIAVTDMIEYYAVAAITITVDEVRSYDIEYIMSEHEAVSAAKSIVEQYRNSDIGS